jgi:hypothetical protein
VLKTSPPKQSCTTNDVMLQWFCAGFDSDQAPVGLAVSAAQTREMARYRSMGVENGGMVEDMAFAVRVGFLLVGRLRKFPIRTHDRARSDSAPASAMVGLAVARPDVPAPTHNLGITLPALSAD